MGFSSSRMDGDTLAYKVMLDKFTQIVANVMSSSLAEANNTGALPQYVGGNMQWVTMKTGVSCQCPVYRYITNLPMQRNMDGTVGKYMVMQFKLEPGIDNKPCGIRVTSGTINLSDVREYNTNDNINVTTTKLYRFSKVNNLNDLTQLAVHASKHVALPNIMKCVWGVNKPARVLKHS